MNVYIENMSEQKNSIVFVYYALWSGSLQKSMGYRALFSVVYLKKLPTHLLCYYADYYL